MKYARKSTGAISTAILAAATFCVSNPQALAQEEKAGGGGDLRAATQNPISSLISVPFKLNFDYGADNGDGTILNIQPVYPITKGDWNYVSRVILPVASVDGAISTPENPSPSGGTDNASGVGDTKYSLYLSPVKTGKVIWGAGPSVMLPTAKEDQLGSGRLSAGVTGVALSQVKWGSMGILGRQLWSIDSDDERADVNQSLIQPFVNYNLDAGWYLLTDMSWTANWEASSSQRWTVPVGGGGGRIYKIGGQAVNNRLEAYYNVERPDAAPEWSWSFTFQFLFPK